jgi:hypothetical protein
MPHDRAAVPGRPALRRPAVDTARIADLARKLDVCLDALSAFLACEELGLYDSEPLKRVDIIHVCDRLRDDAIVIGKLVDSPHATA